MRSPSRLIPPRGTSGSPASAEIIPAGLPGTGFRLPDGRLAETESNPFYGKIKTVSDLVLFINAQAPMMSMATFHLFVQGVAWH
jgi:hypothetical protein